MEITLILYLLAAVGMTLILVDGSVFDPFRLWLGNNDGFLQTVKNVWNQVRSASVSSIYRGFKKFTLKIIQCYQCAGFWSGVAVGLILKVGGVGLLPFPWWMIPFELFICGCASSAVNVFVASILSRLNGSVEGTNEVD